MQLSNGHQKAILVFKSITELTAFKRDCQCDDFYIDRDELSLVGSFTEDQLQSAKNNYSATFQLTDWMNAYYMPFSLIWENDTP